MYFGPSDQPQDFIGLNGNPTTEPENPLNQGNRTIRRESSRLRKRGMLSVKIILGIPLKETIGDMHRKNGHTILGDVPTSVC